MFQRLEMSFRNFMYANTNEDLSFLLKEPSLEVGTSSPLVSINMEPHIAIAETTEQLVENTADSGGSPRQEKLVIHTGSVAGRIKERKLPPKADSPFVAISDDDEGKCFVPSYVLSLYDNFVTRLFVFACIPNVLELQDSTACHLKISAIAHPAWKGHLDNQLDLELFDLHGCCYAMQAVVDNSVNRKARELLKVVEQINGECKVLKDREKSRDQECEELRVKCEVVMTDFDKNPAVVALREKIVTLQGESDDMGKIVTKIVNACIFNGRCLTFEEIAKMKEPLDITNVKGYRTSYKQEHTKAGNNLATATFTYLVDVVADPHAHVEKATPSPASMSPPSQITPATASSSSKIQSPSLAQ
ncbi:hypothetical protein Tco_0639260 [Tanacetum coccineum]